MASTTGKHAIKWFSIGLAKFSTAQQLINVQVSIHHMLLSQKLMCTLSCT